MATQKDFEAISSQVDRLGNREKIITHLVQQQATVVNESLWEIKAHSEILAKLYDKQKTLERTLETFTTNATKQVFSYLEVMQGIDEAFGHVEESLDQLNRFTDDLVLGLSQVASEKLPTQFFSPQQMGEVIGEIRQRLPVGWRLIDAPRPGNLWIIYREAKVSIAVANQSLRIDESRQFRLYRTIQLDKAVNNASHGVQYKDVPEVLAVSDDLQSFVELTGRNASACDAASRPICHFHTGISRRNGSKSCVIALFLNDTVEVEKSCKREFTSWRGSEVAYLGDRHWAITAEKKHEIVIACPPGGPEPGQTVIQVAPIGIFEILPTCSAHSTDWIFPASMVGAAGWTWNKLRNLEQRMEAHEAVEMENLDNSTEP